MTSRKRIGDFLGSDTEYIAYLESIVRQAIAVPSPSPSSPARSNGRRNRTDDDEAPGNSIEFVPYEPATNEQESSTSPPPPKRLRGQHRWKHEMETMFNDLSAYDWSSERARVGLSSPGKIRIALDITRGTKPHAEFHFGDTVLLATHHDSSYPILQLLDTFATATAALKVEKTFTAKIYSFRILVFVSLCCVALHHKVDISLVNEIMQKCISESCEKNLKRLRNGALWVNRMTCALSAAGFGTPVSEFFFLRGRPIAQYGRFADAGAPGFSHFQARFISSFRSQTGLDQAHPHFGVPSIIKTIVGDIYSLHAICSCLGYDANYLSIATMKFDGRGREIDDSPLIQTFHTATDEPQASPHPQLGYDERNFATSDGIQSLLYAAAIQNQSLNMPVIVSEGQGVQLQLGHTNMPLFVGSESLLQGFATEGQLCRDMADSDTTNNSFGAPPTFAFEQQSHMIDRVTGEAFGSSLGAINSIPNSASTTSQTTSDDLWSRSFFIAAESPGDSTFSDPWTSSFLIPDPTSTNPWMSSLFIPQQTRSENDEDAWPSISADNADH